MTTFSSSMADPRGRGEMVGTVRARVTQRNAEARAASPDAETQRVLGSAIRVRLRKCATVPGPTQSATAPFGFGPDLTSLTKPGARNSLRCPHLQRAGSGGVLHQQNAMMSTRPRARYRPT